MMGPFSKSQQIIVSALQKKNESPDAMGSICSHFGYIFSAKSSLGLKHKLKPYILMMLILTLSIKRRY